MKTLNQHQFDADFLKKQRSHLLFRKKNKQDILDEGGQQALSHSPNDVARINFALKRMDEGQYGICTPCGGLIEVSRLKIIPETPFCTSCANQVEAQ